MVLIQPILSYNVTQAGPKFNFANVTKIKQSHITKATETLGPECVSKKGQKYADVI